MIKQGLQIKLGQSLSMTPQLQQAIRMLQLSTIDLQQEIQQTLESNPLLEEMTDYEEFNQDSMLENDDSGTESNVEETLPDDLAADTDWDDVYDMSSSDSNISKASSASDSNLIETMNAEVTGLKEHLLWQINTSHFSLQDKMIAATLIDSLDEKGFLTESVADIYASLSHQLLIDEDEVTAILHYIQHLDPLGVGARDLQECLLIQLNHLYSNHDLYQKTCLLLEKNLDLLEKRDYKKIKKAYNLTDKEYEQLINLLRSLNPNPGHMFEATAGDYITPDVFIKKTHDGQWIATLNQDIESNLRVNEYYKNMIQQTVNTKDKKYLQDNLQQAKGFIKALQNRESTILNVTNEIIKRQSAFLKYGDQAMKPMVLKDIAEDLGVHESTVSRASSQKYMHTPHGIYEIKYFFSSHVATNTGGECSSTAIRAMIQQLVKEENPDKPLSDNKLTNLLGKQGIKVARRTVAKYREALSIPSSRERKCLA